MRNAGRDKLPKCMQLHLKIKVVLQSMGSGKLNTDAFNIFHFFEKLKTMYPLSFHSHSSSYALSGTGSRGRQTQQTQQRDAQASLSPDTSSSSSGRSPRPVPDQPRDIVPP
ncbi:hypothetical protein ILYODFUR_030891, partial [Ilyodon furcidens]